MNPSLKLLSGIGVMAVGIALTVGALTVMIWDSFSGDIVANSNQSSLICSDFESRQEAEVYFASLEDEAKLTSGLDSNRNELPCEMLRSSSVNLVDESFEVICRDFHHREEANLFFENHGGPDNDPHRLDSDGDGNPCEWLPSMDDFDGVIEKFLEEGDADGQRSQSRNCVDFDDWAQANRLFVDSGGPKSDPYGLDGDGDGVPCESLPGAP